MGTEKDEVVEAPSEAPSAPAEVAENQNIESQPAPAEAPSEEAPAPTAVTEEAPAQSAATEEAPAKEETASQAAAPVVTEVAAAAAPAPGTVYRPPVAGVRGRVPPGGHTSGPFW